MSRGCQTLLVLLACTASLLAAVGPLEAATGRFRGTVVDEDGEPIAGVSVAVTSADLPDFYDRLETNKRGSFTLTVARIEPIYTLQFTKAGYRSLKAEIKVRATEIGEETYTLPEVAGEEATPELPTDAAATLEQNAVVQAFNEGLSSQRAGDLETARARFGAAIAEDAGLAPAHIALATVNLDLGDYERALASAERGLELRPLDREALRVRYESLLGLGRGDEAAVAKSELEKAEGQVVTAQSLYNEGSEAYQAQDLEMALAKFREAAEMNPSLYEAHHAIATILVHRGDHTGAAEAADRALELEPDDPRTLRVAYDAYRALGERERVSEIAQRLAAVDSEFGAVGLVEQGGELFNAGDIDGARGLLERALALDPGQGWAHYLLGLCALNSGDTAQAKQHLAKFLELSPEAAEAATAREMLGALK